MNCALIFTDQVGQCVENVLNQCQSPLLATDNAITLNLPTIKIPLTNVTLLNSSTYYFDLANTNSVNTSTALSQILHQLCFNQYTYRASKMLLQKSNSTAVGLGSLASAIGGSAYLLKLSASHLTGTALGGIALASGMYGAMQYTHSFSYSSPNNEKKYTAYRQRAFLFFSLSLVSMLVFCIKYPWLATKQLATAIVATGGYLGIALYYHRYMKT
jgi:hypothetical protein